MDQDTFRHSGGGAVAGRDEGVQFPNSSRARLLARHPWLVFVLPLAVYMLVGSFEPTPPKAGCGGRCRSTGERRNAGQRKHVRTSVQILPNPLHGEDRTDDRRDVLCRARLPAVPLSPFAASTRGWRRRRRAVDLDLQLASGAEAAGAAGPGLDHRHGRAPGVQPARTTGRHAACWLTFFSPSGSWAWR